MKPLQTKAERIVAPLRKVTPLSKYLAMVIFILMPFLGGWIGYHAAPERTVEINVSETDINESINPAKLYWHKDSNLGFWMLIPDSGPDGEELMPTYLNNEQATSIEFVSEPDGYAWPWKIYVENVTNETELANFIDDRYTSRRLISDGICAIESLEPTTYRDTFDVILGGPGVYDGDTSCGIGSKTYIKYSPSLKKAALWDAGQDHKFEYKLTDVRKSYADEMAASFHFEE